MKYMTFNSSCSYAGLANLLSLHGIDTEDRTIALEMHLPYLFSKENGQYLSGPMLQSAQWFNLYLHPIGFTLKEYQISREKVCSYLQIYPPAMLGLHVTPESKHAVICTTYQGGKYHFLNNKHQTSSEPETLYLSESELKSRLDETVIIGVLEKTLPTHVDFIPYLEQSQAVLRSLRTDINTFCAKPQVPAAQREALDALFRPIILDGITMLDLLEKPDLSAVLKTIRTQLLNVISSVRPAVLEREINLPLLNTAISSYIDIIKDHQQYITQTGANQ